TAASSGSGSPPETNTSAPAASAARIRKLAATSAAECCAGRIRRTVHQSVPKYSSPMTTPPAVESPSNAPGMSLIVPLLRLLVVRAANLPLLHGDPVPGVPASHQESADHQHQCPREAAGPAGIDPDSRRDAEHGGNRDRPPDHAIHPEPEPGPALAMAAGLPASLGPMRDPPGQRIFRRLHVRG